MNEREQATKIANMWLDFQMNPLTQMVPGDPDCDACILARQYIRATSENDWLKAELKRLMELSLASSGSDDGGNTRSSFG